MDREIVYKRKVYKQLKKIPRAKQRRILDKIEELAGEVEVGKALQGDLKGFFSIRIWPFRVIYKFDRKKVIIYSVAHRKEVYR